MSEEKLWPRGAGDVFVGLIATLLGVAILLSTVWAWTHYAWTVGLLVTLLVVGTVFWTVLRSTIAEVVEDRVKRRDAARVRDASAPRPPRKAAGW